MILIPNDLTDLKKYRIDEVLLYLLGRSAVRLSVVELSKQLEQLRDVRSYGVRGVRRGLALLQEKGVVDAVRDEKKRCWTYSIRQDVLEKGVQQAQRKLRACDVFEDFYQNKDEDAYLKTVSFTSLQEVDTFVEEFEQFWVEHLRSPNEKIVYYDLLYNRQCLTNVHSLTDLYKRNKIVHYVVCKNKNFVSRKKEGLWLNKQAFIRLGAKKKHAWDTIVLGSYVITIRYSDPLLSDMQRIYKEVPRGEVLQQLWQLRGGIIVTLRKDHLCSLLSDPIQEAFFDPLSDMLIDLGNQKSSGVPLHVTSKYQYTLVSQLHYCTSERFIIERDQSAFPWSGTSKKTGFYLQHLDEMTSGFDTGKPITWIELGVGPKIQPGPLLHQLDSRFAGLQVVCVDYSDAVLETVAPSVEHDLPGIADVSFLQADFLDPQAPKKILDKITHDQRIFAMTGSTGSNLEEEEFQQFFNSLLTQQGDVYVVDTESLENPEGFSGVDGISRRYTPTKTKFDAKAFYELGFDDEHFSEIGYVFNPDTWSVEGYLVLKTIPEQLLPAMQYVKLNPGDKIRFFKSRKPSEKLFSQILSRLTNTSNQIYRGPVEQDLSRYLLGVGRVN